jgi:hypothetical protein
VEILAAQPAVGSKPAARARLTGQSQHEGQGTVPPGVRQTEVQAAVARRCNGRVSPAARPKTKRW